MEPKEIVEAIRLLAAEVRALHITILARSPTPAAPPARVADTAMKMLSLAKADLGLLDV